MQLVGATGGFIRKPFLFKGIMQGLFAGIIANLMLGVVIYTTLKNIPDFEQVTDLKMMIFLFGIVILFGVVISGLSTFFAIRKYLRLHSDDLHY